jgi:hypothetical protein
MEDQFKDNADKVEGLLEKRKQIINMLSSTLQEIMYKVKGTSKQFKTIKDDLNKVFEMLQELSRLLVEITLLGNTILKSWVLLYLGVEYEVRSDSLEWLESGYIDIISPSYLIQDEIDEEASINARQVIPLHWMINGTI